MVAITTQVTANYTEQRIGTLGSSRAWRVRVRDGIIIAGWVVRRRRKAWARGRRLSADECVRLQRHIMVTGTHGARV